MTHTTISPEDLSAQSGPPPLTAGDLATRVCDTILTIDTLIASRAARVIPPVDMLLILREIVAKGSCPLAQEDALFAWTRKTFSADTAERVFPMIPPGPITEETVP